MADRQVDRALQTLRIIVAAMMLGIVSFGAITVFLITGGATTTDAGLGSVMLPILEKKGISPISGADSTADRRMRRGEKLDLSPFSVEFR